MTISIRQKRLVRTTWVILVVWTMQLMWPLTVFALTSGPSQPENQAFQQAGTSDMVNLFTGDMKYNIPLFDIDGYPVNMNYNSGIGIDDEASWVGLGWNLNVGAINRQLRGLPDDFAGDETKVTHYTKPKITVGGRVTAKGELFGFSNVTGSFTLGVFSDNYTGIGAEIGANAGISFSLANDGFLTAGLGLGVLSSTASGVDVTPSVSLSIREKSTEHLTISSGLSASLGYNTRAGLKDLTLGTSFSMKGEKTETFVSVNSDMEEVYETHGTGKKGDGGFSASGTLITYNTEAISPKVNIPYYSAYDSYSFDLGLAKTVAFTAIGGTGYRNVRRVLNKVTSSKSYGYLYAERAKDQRDVSMDFIREQDNPVVPELPNLALPVHTPDLFTYSGQVGGGQFRLYRGGTGIYSDNEATDVSQISTKGFDLGAGAWFHGGVTDFEQNSTSTSRKWQSGNYYSAVGDFQDIAYNDPQKEHVAFRIVGERVASNPLRDAKLQQTDPVAININTNLAETNFKLGNGATVPVGDKIEKAERTPTQTVISYLTSAEADRAGRDRKIKNYPFNNTSFVPPPYHKIPESNIELIDRVSTYRKGHHISEITVTDDQGSRSIYGIPVYNIKQEEYTFAIGQGYAKFSQNQTSFDRISDSEPNHKKGIDHYNHKEEQPGYATSYLLTQVLSADYIDKTGDGVTDDDAGTAIKFNYSKVDNKYNWRTPFASKTSGQQQNATINKGLLGDPDDDKASIVYGEKELWYLGSIESKTKIAYFITEDRSDAIGALAWFGNISPNGARQKRLVEIRLYSKSNTDKPIKVIKLGQSYSLCPGTPNSISTGAANPLTNLGASAAPAGKLTLDRIWFEYGKTDKGKNNPYVFTYNTQGYENSSTDGLTTIPYQSMATDRWGNYKGNNQQSASSLTNDEFPYTPQNDVNKINKNAALWNLSTIQLPSGGQINVDYESDDYAYVQNRKAMQMVPFETFNNNTENDLAGATGINLTIDPTGAPTTPCSQTQWFKENYLNGTDYIYTKIYMRMANDQNPANSWEEDKDFVTTYCKVKTVCIAGNTATITFEDSSDGGVTDNPIRFAAWQNVRSSYPRYAFPGFKNRISDNSITGAIEGVVTAVVNAGKNLGELKENFYAKAKRKGWNRYIIKNKSFVRLVKRDGKKMGGGLRVKKISIKDNWHTMAGEKAQDGAYGQSYDYTTEVDGKVISSGVATYEPSVGNDESPMKLPVNYVQKVKGSLNNFFSLEEPFGESLFPAPSVGYSKVTVRDLNANGDVDILQKTGYSVSEFYTAKEFPVKVSVTPLTKNDRKSKNFYSMLKSDSHQESILSQGYYLELNDMHGKGKAELTYNQGGALIASTKYSYNTEPTGAGEMRLRNEVQVVENGHVRSATIGRDLEFYTDFREHESSNVGRTYNIGIDVFPVPFWPFFALPHGIPRKANSDYKLFRSACAVKVAQYYGVLDEVEQMENGSTITTKNMVFDANTGQPVVTRTQNEFKNYVYKVNFPAHWVYQGMAGAYQNVGALMKGLTMSGTGLNAPYSTILAAGDELLNVTTTTGAKLLWVVEDELGNKRLIDKQGYVQETINSNDIFKVIRSGHRNQLSATASSLTCLENPVVNNYLILEDAPDRSLKVLNAQVQNFDQNWEPEPYKVVMDNKSVYVPAHDKYAYMTFEDGQWVNVDCRRLYIAKIKVRFYKSNVFIPENLVIGNYITFKVYYYDENQPYQTWEGGSADPFGGSEGTGLTTHMYNDEYAILTEEFDCPNQRYTAKYLHHFELGYHGDNYPNAKFLGHYNGGYQTVFSQQPVNPFITGHKGNWRPKEGKVVQLQREDLSLLNSKGANIAKSGYIKDFTFNWGYNSYYPYWSENNDYLWKVTNRVTAYNRYGQETENKDATDNQYGLDALGLQADNFENHEVFGKYQAANFLFNGQLPEAVASNAMHREIYSNSFEDVKFRSSHFNDKENTVDFKDGINPITNTHINETVSHTGNYSLTLPQGGIKLSTFVHYQTHNVEPALVLNEKREYLISNDKYFWGFEPMPGKKYLFTVWVRDNLNTVNKNLDVNLSLNNNPTPIDLKCVAVVEKWKKLEGVIDLSGMSSLQKLTLQLSPTTSNVKIDDIRIHPYNGHMKTYAYDDKNYRLMAELDENAFASFYEYDDEGILVRVKKETTRGIVTLKETRSALRKNQ